MIEHDSQKKYGEPEEKHIVDPSRATSREGDPSRTFFTSEEKREGFQNSDLGLPLSGLLWPKIYLFRSRT